MSSLYVKALDVVSSCRTQEQLLMAYKYLLLCQRSSMDWHTTMSVYTIFCSKWVEVAEDKLPPTEVPKPKTSERDWGYTHD